MPFFEDQIFDRQGSGTIAANNTSIQANTAGSSSVIFNVTGTWVATAVFEGTTDGTNWITLNPILQSTSAIISSITANGTVLVDCGGYNLVRIRTSAYTSGTLAVAWDASVGSQVTQVFNNNAATLQATVTQGTSPWVNNMTQVGSSNITLGQKISTASIPVVLSSDDVNKLSYYDNSQIDPLGKLRVSTSTVSRGYYFSNSSHPLHVATSLVGSATVALTTAASAMRLTCTTNSTDSAILQTKAYYRYIPNSGVNLCISGTIGAKKANVRQRWGYFDALNGTFFQQDSSNLAIVTRTNTSGSAVDTAVNQSSWNVDKLDGTGTSGVTLDTTKHNQFIIDFTYHGAGRVRFGILYNGRIVYCHQVNEANLLTTPFIRTPALPMRVELTNTTTTANTTTLDVVGMVTQIESVNDMSPMYTFTASTGRTSTAVGATTLPLISIRPKTTFNSLTNRIAIVPTSVSVATGSQPTLVSVILNPTLTGASFASADTNSATEFDIAATAVSGGTIISQFYIAASATGGLLGIGATVSPGSGSTALGSILLGLDIAGSVQDIITVCAQSTAGNTNTFGQIGWGEYQ